MGGFGVLQRRLTIGRSLCGGPLLLLGGRRGLVQRRPDRRIRMKPAGGQLQAPGYQARIRAQEIFPQLGHL